MRDDAGLGSAVLLNETQGFNGHGAVDVGPRPLDLQQLMQCGLAATDSIIIDGLPPGASLTRGRRNVDRSWTLQPDEVFGLCYVSPAADGQSYTLSICVLTPDPQDHGLAKTKAQFTLPVTAPLPAPSGLLSPSETSPSAEITPTIELPRLDAAVESAPLPPLPPELTTDETLRRRIEAHIATLHTQWQASETARLESLTEQWQEATANHVAGAEARIKAKHQEQLAAVESWVAADDAKRRVETEAKWKAEIERQVAAAEAKLTARHKEQLASAEARWRARQAMRPGSSEAAVDDHVAESK